MHRYRALNEGPNGLAVDGGRVYGATDSDAFALSADTGRPAVEPASHQRAREQFVDIAPVVWEGLVFTSTVGFPPVGRGAIYALDAATGAVRWKFDTIREPWRHPLEAGGGGLWYPVSVDDEGRLYAGNSNPQPWGGSPERPNGAAFPGPVLYTNSLLVLDARSGRLLWHDQVTPHDIRDYDFAGDADPGDGRGRRTLVFGAGKAGRVIAWDRETRAAALGDAASGMHRNDLGPLPPRRVTVCPGLFGGVETPMAYAEGRLFVPVVDLCGWGSATSSQPLTSVVPSRGRAGSSPSTPRRGARSGCGGCRRRTSAARRSRTTSSSPPPSTGRRTRSRPRTESRAWRARMRAGINACPAVLGDLVLFGAGAPRAGGVTPELVAFGLP